VPEFFLDKEDKKIHIQLKKIQQQQKWKAKIAELKQKQAKEK